MIEKINDIKKYVMDKADSLYNWFSSVIASAKNFFCCSDNINNNFPDNGEQENNQINVAEEIEVINLDSEEDRRCNTNNSCFDGITTFFKQCFSADSPPYSRYNYQYRTPQFLEYDYKPITGDFSCLNLAQHDVFKCVIL